MLLKVAAAFPCDWDTVLSFVVFAYNETPHRVTGFSSHELMFGFPLWGPQSLLRYLWVRPDTPQYQTYHSYFSDLRERIIKSSQIAKGSLAIACEKQRL